MASQTRTSQEAEVRFRKLFVTIVVALVTILFLRMIAPFLQAMLLAAVMTGILYPLYTRLRARLSKDVLAAGATVFLVLIAVVLPLMFLVGTFTREAIRLTEVVGPWVEQTANGDGLPSQLPQWLPFRDQLNPYRNQIYSRFGDVISQTGTFVVDSLSKITQGTVAFVLNLFVMLYALFFFLLAGPRLLSIFDYTPLTQLDREVIVEKGISITRATVKGTIVIGVIQGTLAGAAFAIVGIPAAVFWSAVMALASIVPVLGTALVWLPAVAYLLIQGNIAAGLGLLAWCTIVVSGADNIVRPRLIGNDTKMPDVLILLSTLGGIAMFGATGVIIGPVLAGLFLTSWHIFAATFRRELEPSTRIQKQHDAALEKELNEHEAENAIEK